MNNANKAIDNTESATNKELKEQQKARSSILDTLCYPASRKILDIGLRPLEQAECYNPTNNPNTTIYDYEKALLNEVLTKLMTSTLFHHTVQESHVLNTTPVHLKEIPGKIAGCYDPDTKCISLQRHLESSKKFSSEYNRIAAYVSIAAHEFAHARQDQKGVFLGRQGFSLKNLNFLTRILEADAVAFQTAICWELKQNGYDGPWQYMQQHQGYQKSVQAFEEHLTTDNLSLESGPALNAAFLAWAQQKSNRTYYDVQSCNSFKELRKSSAFFYSAFDEEQQIKGKIARLSDSFCLAAKNTVKKSRYYLKWPEIQNLNIPEFWFIDSESRVMIRDLENKHPKPKQTLPPIQNPANNIAYRPR